MEEASVAGESPDRSKQRESSAEPTSGSAGPVPEARGEARDPRLAMAREDAAAKPRGGGVDTATTVLSVRDREPGADADADASDSADGSDAADSADSADSAEGSGDASAAGGGDDRLRAAVSAWVRSAGGPGRADAATGTGTGTEEADADEDEATAESDREDGGPEDGAEPEPAAAADADGGADGDDTGDAADGSASAEPEDEPVADADPVDAPEDTDGDTAEDADASGADASDSTGPEDAEPADAAPRDAEPQDAEPEDAEPEDAGPEDAPEPAAASKAEDQDGDQDDAGPDSPEPDAGPGSDSGPVSDAGSSSDAGSAPALDHPTTVFKAVRPPKPAVDQPTTMLKAPKPPQAPAGDPERTSRFVALKPLDEPGTKAPDATRAVPQVGPERTRQVPLPPKPPIDLLAELTNTPPPPETAVRTLVRRFKIWTPLVLLLAVVFAIVQAVRPLPAPTLALTADDSYTFEGSKASLPWPSEGQGWMDVEGIGTMGNFGDQTPVAIGSVAKAMTAYIVLKDHPLKSGEEGPAITVDATAEKEGGYDKDGESTLNTVKEGDKLSEKQALSAIMIPSANNIARLLARWDAGSEAAFVKKMNATAKELGMDHTTYTDPSGLIETTVSTAEDQVKLGDELVKIPALIDITKLPSWTDPSGQKWNNYNRLVPYNGAIGLKTGTTTKAGGNLLFAATKVVDGQTVTVVGAILGQHTAPIIDTVNAVSKTAMLGAQNALTSQKILKKGDVVGYVDDQLGGHTPVVVTKDVSAVGWAGLKVELSFRTGDVPHTAKAGTEVGTLTVGDGSNGAVKVPVALQKDLTEPAFTAKLKRIG
ncbi:D-alanyl-D-alanine carboxypeptidase [Streptomyces mangrovisoli]|uniref:serine-type D-Ala-D-Ala carboxypeptidase n=1 Tax=Streptomyces mangrovisoli TaxID=1428628 RepID=A0A1J4P5P8_9ACTN|nr:D-alanyl-D-alanine carboxypeptidase [Streptomyces mangrovisoli]OIJ69920.1 D-alanyl-D-alanine carboxypeptidase [Streptomyces mangrovisoli]